MCSVYIGTPQYAARTQWLLGVVGRQHKYSINSPELKLSERINKNQLILSLMGISHLTVRDAKFYFKPLIGIFIDNTETTYVSYCMQVYLVHYTKTHVHLQHQLL